MAFDLIPFLNEHFPGTALEGGIFYRWPIGIRFELAGHSPLLSERLSQAAERAAALYEAMFAMQDRCIAAGEEWPGGPSVFAQEDLGLSRTDGAWTVPASEESDSDSFVLRWTEQPARSFQYAELFRRIANSDHGLPPSVAARVYLLNPQAGLMLHMYDDRGLDVVASGRQVLAGIYESFNAWILDYDRARIDEVFQTASGREHPHG